MDNKQSKSTQHEQINNMSNKTKQHRIDLNVFKDKKEECQTENVENGEIVTNCSHLLRIVSALKYYQVLCGKNGDDDNARSIFIDFVVDSYPLFLSDYIHFVCNHSDSAHLNKISLELENNYNFHQCSNVTDCDISRRHYRNNKEHKTKKHEFYLDIFNALHFLLFHAQSLGLRDLRNKDKEKQNELDEETKDYLECIDHEIAAIQKEIELKREKYQNAKNTKNIAITSVENELINMTGSITTTIITRTIISCNRGRAS